MSGKRWTQVALAMGIGALCVCATAPVRADDCALVGTEIYYCGEDNWPSKMEPVASVVMYRTADFSVILGFTEFGEGTADGLTLEEYVPIYLDRLTMTAPSTDAVITTLERDPIEKDGHAGERLVTLVTVPDDIFTIAASIYVFDNHLIGITTTISENDYSDHHRKLHEAVLSDVHFGKAP